MVGIILKSLHVISIFFFFVLQGLHTQGKQVTCGLLGLFCTPCCMVSSHSMTAYLMNCSERSKRQSLCCQSKWCIWMNFFYVLPCNEYRCSWLFKGWLGQTFKLKKLKHTMLTWPQNTRNLIYQGPHFYEFSVGVCPPPPKEDPFTKVLCRIPLPIK